MPDDFKLEKIGQEFLARFQRYEADRQPWEQQALRNLRQYRGIYDPEVKFDKNRSKAYPKLTRIKCISVISRLMEMLFPSTERNWTLRSSPVPNIPEVDLQRIIESVQMTGDENQDTKAIEEGVKAWAANRALAMESEIEDQLQELGGTKELSYVALARKVIESGVRFGLGVLKGPMVVDALVRRWVRDDLSGKYRAETRSILRPTYDPVSVWDYYPDMTAKNFQSMEGQFERHVMSRTQFGQLRTRPDFMLDRIDLVLQKFPEGNYELKKFEQELRSLGVASSADSITTKTRKYEVLEWWGEVTGQDLSDFDISIQEEDLKETFSANLWLCDSIVIKATVNPFTNAFDPYHQFVFEEDDINLPGVGLPQIMRDSQLAVSAGSRMLLDNASVVTGPNLEIIEDLLSADTDMTSIQAWKIWKRSLEDAPAAAGIQAVREINFNSHISDLLSIIELFRRFADTETFVTPQLEADFTNVGKEPFRTAQGASLLLSGAALPFRDVVRNFDNFTMSFISSLYEWNMQFNDRPEIRGDFEVEARGATTLMAKEVLSQALNFFAQTLSEEDSIYVDRKQLLTERAKALDLPVNKLFVSDSEAESRRSNIAEGQERARLQQDRQLQAEIRETLASAFAKVAQAQKAGASAEQIVAEIAQLEADNGSGRSVSSGGGSAAGSSPESAR